MIASLASAAWACSCAGRPAHLALPDQAHVSGPIRLFLMNRWPEDGAQRAAELLRLRGPDGALVPLEAEELGWRLDLVPTRPLAPGRYRFEQRLSWGADGQLLPPVSVGRQPVAVGEGWFTVDELEVVDGAAAPGPVPPVVDWDRRYVSSSCGPANNLRTEVPPIPGARWVEVEVQDQGVVGTFGGAEGAFVYVSDDVCWARKVTLPPERGFRVRLVAVGLDGARAPGSWQYVDSVGAPYEPVWAVPRPRPVAVPPPVDDGEPDRCWGGLTPADRLRRR